MNGAVLHPTPLPSPSAFPNLFFPVILAHPPNQDSSQFATLQFPTHFPPKILISSSPVLQTPPLKFSLKNSDKNP